MGMVTRVRTDPVQVSAVCPFFVDEYSGICVSCGVSYIPSLAERSRYCHEQDFSHCPLFCPMGRGYIRVMYDDRIYGVIPDFMLDAYIDEGRVMKFYRAEGWVVVGCGPIRVRRRPYGGPERRRFLAQT